MPESFKDTPCHSVAADSRPTILVWISKCHWGCSWYSGAEVWQNYDMKGIKILAKAVVIRRRLRSHMLCRWVKAHAVWRRGQLTLQLYESHIQCKCNQSVNANRGKETFRASVRVYVRYQYLTLELSLRHTHAPFVKMKLQPPHRG